MMSLTHIKHAMEQRLAASHIAGPQLADALRVCRRVAGYGWGSTLGPWHHPDDSLDSIESSYRLALQAIVDERLECSLSIKLPALAYRVERVKQLVELAGACGVWIHTDAQAPDSAAPSFTVLERIIPLSRHVGCTLPSRWRRSMADAERAIALGIPVRVVKGQWPDPVAPYRDERAQFLDLIDVLAGRAVQVAVATHDARLARAALMRLCATGTPCLLEQLVGLPIRDASVARPLSVPLRVYIPYGCAYLPYNLSTLWRRSPVTAWIWVLRDGVIGKHKALLRTRVERLRQPSDEGKGES